jgi:hypothetical protein
MDSFVGRRSDMVVVPARLAPGDLPIVAEALVWIIVVRLGLRWTRLRTLISALERVPATACAPLHRVPRIVRIAEGLTRRLSRDATCLTRALVVYALLRRRQVGASLVIGTPSGQPGPVQPFEAHAWIEHDGRVLCGAAPHQRFHELWRVPAAPVPGLTA